MIDSVLNSLTSLETNVGPSIIGSWIISLDSRVIVVVFFLEKSQFLTSAISIIK